MARALIASGLVLLALASGCELVAGFGTDYSTAPGADGSVDAPTADSTTDTGNADTGKVDSGDVDTGNVDSSVDAGSVDSGNVDADASMCGPWGCPVTLAAGDQSFDGGNPYFFPQAIAFLGDGTLVFTDKAKVNTAGYNGGVYTLDASASGLAPLTSLVADPANPIGLSATGTTIWWLDAKGFNQTVRMLDLVDAGEVLVANATLGGQDGLAGTWLAQAFGDLWLASYLHTDNDIIMADIPRFEGDAATMNSLFDAAVAQAAGNTPTNTSVGFATGPDLAIALNNIYWTSTAGIWTCSNIDTGSCTPTLLYSTPGAIAIATDGVHLYWTASNGVYWANPTADAGGIVETVSNASNCSLCLAIVAPDPDHVYWSAGDTIYLGSSSDAGAPLTLYKVPHGEDVQRLTIYGPTLFWTAAASTAPYGLVMKVPIR